jgi:hypothetical protein
MVYEMLVGKELDRSSISIIEGLSRNLPGGTGRKPQRILLGKVASRRDLNRAPPEYEIRN